MPVLFSELPRGRPAARMWACAAAFVAATLAVMDGRHAHVLDRLHAG